MMRTGLEDLVEKLGGPAGQVLREMGEHGIVGGVFGATTGLLAPGQDSEGRQRSRLRGALRGGAIGAGVGAAVGGGVGVAGVRGEAAARAQAARSANARREWQAKEDAYWGGTPFGGFGGGHSSPPPPPVPAIHEVAPWLKDVSTKAEAEARFRAAKQQHRAAARTAHPDMGGSTSKMQDLNAQWDATKAQWEAAQQHDAYRKFAALFEAGQAEALRLFFTL